MKIKLFGITREIVGESQLELPKEEKVETVAELKHWLFEQYPGLENLSSLAVAVDHAYAENDTRLFIGQEVALIPPVSGG